MTIAVRLYRQDVFRSRHLIETKHFTDAAEAMGWLIRRVGAAAPGTIYAEVETHDGIAGYDGDIW